jgi:hypothetical protein
MWDRLATPRLLELARQFPAVLILGARQVGKTTLARQVFPQLPYCDLEEPSLRQLFTEDPTFQIEQRAKPGLVLDEVQTVPAVFASLRGIIDAHRQAKGRFLLLGSAQPTLVRQVSESLAGRVGILELEPLTLAEARTGDEPRDWGQVWLRGGFPDALRGSFREWWEAYLRTYVERDLPHLGLEANPLLLRRERLRHPHTQACFWRTAAGAEIDLLLDRGSELLAIEIKAGRGDKTRLARTLETAMADAGARRGWILDQAPGAEPLRPNLQRRNFAEDPTWLPD